MIKNIQRRGWYYLTWNQWSNQSWAQEGEDMVLNRIFGNKSTGYYIDVGAHHPMRFSNTYLFYNKGWCGINIDAMPGSMKLFEKWRSRDINLEMGVAQKDGILDYYVFNEPALNSFSAKLSKEVNLAANKYYVKEVIKVEVKPLNQILNRHLSGQKIDFMSVDVEGFDLDVLQSNDWLKYRPRIVLVEIFQSSLHELEQDPVTKYLKEQGYALYAKTVNTVFFVDLLENV
jgi:FkbM family methyltransferase